MKKKIKLIKKLNKEYFINYLKKKKKKKKKKIKLKNVKLELNKKNYILGF